MRGPGDGGDFAGSGQEHIGAHGIKLPIFRIECAPEALWQAMRFQQRLTLNAGA